MHQATEDRVTPVLGPAQLRAELEAAGLELLGIGRHRAKPDGLVVYLHGNAGQWAQGAAAARVAAVPGVLAVTESLQSPSILLVRVASAGRVEPRDGADTVDRVGTVGTVGTRTVVLP